MGRYGLVLTYLLLAGVSALAQGAPKSAAPPATPPAQPPNAAALDSHLQRWEQKMTELKSLYGTIKRTDTDKATGDVVKLVGTAEYLKDGKGATLQHLAVLQLNSERSNELFEKVVITGAQIYQFSPAAKEIKVFELPKSKPGQVGDDNVLSFLFGMKAETARKRYDLSMEKEDKFYIYINVLPLTQADKDDFKRARIVLNRDSYLPRQVWFEDRNGKTTTWDIPPETLKPNANLKRSDFDSPKLPDGWKMVPGQKEPAPAAPAKPVPPKP
jgi:TIGR03009 family protein